jgi:hypothetical protein
MTPGGARRLAAALRAAVAVAALLAAGCPGPHPPAERPYPPPSADELLAALAARQAAVRTMNARARATSWIGGDRLRATVLMLVERAGRLRFEAEISLQGTVSILTTDGGRFQLLDMRKNELRQGPACPANVASLIRIPLAPDDVAAILLGDVKLPTTDHATVSWDAERGADALAVPGAGAGAGGGETRVLFQRRAAGDVDIVGAEAIGPDGRRLWRTSYEDLAGAAGARQPAVIRFAERNDSFDQGVDIRVKDRTVNAEPRPTDFTIAPPAGTPVIEVGCGAPGAGAAPP